MVIEERRRRERGSGRGSCWKVMYHIWRRFQYWNHPPLHTLDLNLWSSVCQYARVNCSNHPSLHTLMEEKAHQNSPVGWSNGGKGWGINSRRKYNSANQGFKLKVSSTSYDLLLEHQVGLAPSQPEGNVQGSFLGQFFPKGDLKF